MGIKNPACIDGDNVHHEIDGSLIIMHTEPEIELGVDLVVRWCKICGACVVDKEVDGRLVGAVVEMKFPTYLRERFNK